MLVILGKVLALIMFIIKILKFILKTLLNKLQKLWEASIYGKMRVQPLKYTDYIVYFNGKYFK
mgnify:CR=1 FL=1